MPTGSIPKVAEIQTLSCYRHAALVPMVSALEGSTVVVNQTTHGVHVASFPGSLLKKIGEGKSLGTSTEKLVNFRHQVLAVPIRLQNKITCTCDNLSTQQEIVNSRKNL